METLGRRLRLERESKGKSLEELAQVTRIPLRSLQQLESDRWDELAGAIYIKGYLKAYARALGVSAEPWLQAFREDTDREDSGAPMTAITAPERGGRFGIAITIVILVILFTLALSIVLGKRDSGAQNELSQGNTPCPSALDLPKRFSYAPPTTGTQIASALS